MDDWYDEALCYDVLFGWDPAPERDFVLGASARFGLGRPARTLEPFCGTGRLLRAMPGVAVGFDLNPAMVAFARRSGCVVFRGDAARFSVAPASFDLAYCLIDSFRHLLDEDRARACLASVAQALRPGAALVLGLDVSGGLDAGSSAETWERSRGALRVKGEVSCLGDADPARRVETMRVALEVREGKQRRRLESRQPLRTYTPAQLFDLIASVPELEVVATYDRTYDLEAARPLARIQGSAVLVLRRREPSTSFRGGARRSSGLPAPPEGDRFGSRTPMCPASKPSGRGGPST